MVPTIRDAYAEATTQPPARLALVIGNGSYAYNSSLPNALSDAKRMAAKLGSMGFEMDSKTFDLGQKDLAKVVAAFGEKLRAAGKNTVGFFYYSGHAAQDALGVNYLLPIDAKADTPNAVHSVGTPLQLLIQAMEDADNPVNIVIIDACRDWFESDRKKFPKDPKGLHDMGLHASCLIAYATRSNDTAKEGGNVDSSPYSHRLLEALDQQASDPIVLLLDDVKSRVYSDTDAGQYPLLVDGLTVSGRWSMGSGALINVAAKPEPPGAVVVSGSFLAQLDRKKLLKYCRNKVSFVDALLARRDVLTKYEINSPIRFAYFLSAIAHETGGFQIQEERFGFSVSGLQKQWPKEVTDQKIAQRIVGRPEAVASFVYANRLGNGPPETGDGWKYRGRGQLFVIGKGNYQKFGDMINVNLVDAPDLANDLEIGYAIAAAIWYTAKCNDTADADNLQDTTIRFRGVYNHVQDRQIWLRQAKQMFGVPGSSNAASRP